MNTDPFDECLLSVEQVARPLGYRRRASRFVRQVGEASTEVWYQKSRSAPKAGVKFTVNCSITLLPLLSSGVVAKVVRRRLADPAHWTERLGFLLPENRDVWWEVDTANSSRMAEMHSRWFAEVIHPVLDERAFVAWHVNEWREGRARWIAEQEWREYLRTAEGLGY